jgi:hypothetical protein
MKIRVATWNVAGGRLVNSLDHFDYAKNEDLDYFSSQLEQLNLDIICLQESQFNDNDSFAKRLAKSLNFPYVAETPGCPSHVDKTYKMTPAIISKQPFDMEKPYLLPYPNFKLIHKGKELPPFDRYLLEVKFNNFSVVTAHPEPLGMFDLTYESGEGNMLAKEIDGLISHKFSKPVVFAVDFNFNDVSKVLPETFAKFSLSEALDADDTTPLGDHPDHISFSDNFKVLDNGVIKTETDHYLCWAELEIN